MAISESGECCGCGEDDGMGPYDAKGYSRNMDIIANSLIVDLTGANRVLSMVKGTLEAITEAEPIGELSAHELITRIQSGHPEADYSSLLDLTNAIVDVYSRDEFYQKYVKDANRHPNPPSEPE